jgi:WD40 repeat protein
MMIRKRFAVLSVLLAIIILLSGCGGGTRSETIVIPSTEDEHVADSGSAPFQVKTIYRLSIPDTNNDQLLGWTDSESVVGLFQDIPGATRNLTQSLQRLSPPYEQPEMMQNMDIEPWNLELSPNGKYIAGIKKTKDGNVLKLISLSDGRETIMATIKPRHDLLLTELTWSDNSRYISYLVTDVATDVATGPVRGQTDVGVATNPVVKMAVYDTTARQVKVYPLKGLRNTGSVSEVKMSDDGQSALIVVQNERTISISMGTINGNSFHIKYEHQAGGDQMAWLNKDQFVFLGTEGEIYEYDRRNMALSVLLERVLSFQLSQDRKYIAYSQKDNDTISIFAGKLQGNNVLYKESVYQGVFPSVMYWSPHNDSLLVNGRKIYSTSRQQTNPEPSVVSYNQPFIIKFQ